MASELQQLVKRISVQEEEAVEQMSGCEQGLGMGLCALWRSHVVSHVVWRYLEAMVGGDCWRSIV